KEQVREAFIILDENEEFICIVHDVTEREKIERSLRESQERLQMVVSHAPILLYATDVNGIFT
ncbi:MAG TPA: hypothetical protein DHW02_07800, partial [Ktedonobacter sp.]|nr:hypothetical protein [Ktedonobacter sp.]